MFCPVQGKEILHFYQIFLAKSNLLDSADYEGIYYGGLLVKDCDEMSGDPLKNRFFLSKKVDHLRNNYNDKKDL